MPSPPPINPVEVFARLPLFSALQPEQRQRLAEHTREQRISRGETLFRRGDMANGFYVVIFGQIKLVIDSPQGDEKVVEIINQRQSFGEAVMFLNRPYPVSAVSLNDTLLLHVPKSALDDSLTQDPTFAKAMLAGLSARLHALVKDVEAYSIRSTTQRVIGYLLQQCPDEANGEVIVELPTSKLLIASRLSITPETLSRIFGKLQQGDLIRVQGRSVIIPNVKALQDFVE
ncbi:Crp/Fnr family transcriptional regulator [beta proteobacterium MWH-UniP1]